MPHSDATLEAARLASEFAWLVNAGCTHDAVDYAADRLNRAMATVKREQLQRQDVEAAKIDTRSLHVPTTMGVPK